MRLGVEKMKKNVYIFRKNYCCRLIGMSRTGVIREQQKKKNRSRYKTVR